MPTYNGTKPGRAFCSFEEVRFMFNSCSRSWRLSSRVGHVSNAAQTISCSLLFAQLAIAFLRFKVSRNKLVRTIAAAEKLLGVLISTPLSFVADLITRELKSSTSSKVHSRIRRRCTAAPYSGLFPCISAR